MSGYSLFPGGNLKATAHPEPTRRDPAADRITYAALLKELRWSEADFEHAQKHGFPRHAHVLIGADPGGARTGVMSVYSRKQVDAWMAEFRAFAKKVGT